MPITEDGSTNGPHTQEDIKQVQDTTPVQAEEIGEQEYVDYNDTTTQNTSTGQGNNNSATVIDTETPIIFLFGPPECGKTMTLVRLSRWLQDNGWTVEADKSFKSSNDTGYRKLCDEFPQIIYSRYAAERTKAEEFLLVKVFDGNKKKICQIVEAPGEPLFSISNPNKKGFVQYVNVIMNNKAKKVYLFFTEPDWDSTLGAQYVNRIQQVVDNEKFKITKSKAIIVYNKADKSTSNNLKTMKNDVANHYKGLFDRFKNVHPITKHWREFNCQFAPFVTGDYNDDISQISKQGEKPPQIYTPGLDVYPAALWRAIQKCL